MRRAAVLIGVSTTNGLPKLQAVESGISQMRTWASVQGIQGEDLVVLTDKTEKLRAYQIADAIAALIDRRDLDQLVVYFTGHGIHNRGDYWLLSEAPKMATEAVNVEGSIQLARYCGVSHVVFISDACRTAADGVQMLGITGTEIFPNDPVDGMERPVDAFFACARGKPALEVRVPDLAASSFFALYTEVLSECLAGQHEAAIERTEEDGAQVGLVRAWKLADELLAAVPPRLKKKLGKVPSVNQTPVARISSREGWISRIPAPLPSAPRSAPVEVLFSRKEAGANAVDAADRLLTDALLGKGGHFGSLLGGMRSSPSAEHLLEAAAGSLSNPFASVTGEIACGFRLRGARGRAVHSLEAKGTVLDVAAATLINVELLDGPTSVVLELEDGRSVLLPVIPDFVVELTFDSGELAHVAWEPARIGSRWAEYEPRRAAVHALRGSIAAAAGMGLFRLTNENEVRIARAMQSSKSLDPSIALYAAYAYHETAQRERIQQIRESLELDLGFTFFDIAMVAAGKALKTEPNSDRALPAVPMLSRGWSLLKAFRANLPLELMELQHHLSPSLWTLFNPAGTERLIAALRQGKVHI